MWRLLARRAALSRAQTWRRGVLAAPVRHVTSDASSVKVSVLTPEPRDPSVPATRVSDTVEAVASVPAEDQAGSDDPDAAYIDVVASCVAVAAEPAGELEVRPGLVLEVHVVQPAQLLGHSLAIEPQHAKLARYAAAVTLRDGTVVAVAEFVHLTAKHCQDDVDFAQYGQIPVDAVPEHTLRDYAPLTAQDEWEGFAASLGNERRIQDDASRDRHPLRAPADVARYVRGKLLLTGCRIRPAARSVQRDPVFWQQLLVELARELSDCIGEEGRVMVEAAGPALAMYYALGFRLQPDCRSAESVRAADELTRRLRHCLVTAPDGSVRYAAVTADAADDDDAAAATLPEDQSVLDDVLGGSDDLGLWAEIAVMYLAQEAIATRPIMQHLSLSP